MRKWLERRWYFGKAPSALKPLSKIFSVVASVRAHSLKADAKQIRLPVPVIVVGNIAVGGTGKTPMVIWLALQLQQWGYRPGIISRGYGGKSKKWPLAVDAHSDPKLVGDEPVLIAAETGCPISVGPDRIESIRRLCDRADINVVISDDGLQHYRMPRALEICVVDGERLLGNGWTLPAGPLREPKERLNSVDIVVANGGSWVAQSDTPTVKMKLAVSMTRNLKTGETRPLDSFANSRVHAVAGIGNPTRFFAGLASYGIEVTMHPFLDHHAFVASDLRFSDDDPILMTEKDAVKCKNFATERMWSVPVVAEFSEPDFDTLKTALERAINQFRKR